MELTFCLSGLNITLLLVAVFDRARILIVILFMMSARHCCPVATGGRDRFDILTLSFFCPFQQTWQEKERRITAETGKRSPLLPLHSLFFFLFLLPITCTHAIDITKCNSCHIQALNSQWRLFGGSIMAFSVRAFRKHAVRRNVNLFCCNAATQKHTSNLTVHNGTVT